MASEYTSKCKYGVTNHTNVNKSRDPNSIEDIQATGAELCDLKERWARAGDVDGKFPVDWTVSFNDTQSGLFSL